MKGDISTLSKTDYERIIHFFNCTHDMSPNIAHTVQSLLSELFHFDSSMFWLADTQCNMYNLEFLNFDDHVIYDYTELYASTDVMHPKKQLHYLAAYEKSVLNINETTTPSSLIQSEYYQFVKKHNVIDQMVLYFKSGAFMYGGIGFPRFKGEQPFTLKDRYILQTLANHLQHRIKNSIMMEEMKAKHHFLNKRGHELGIIQVNKHKNVSYYNETAQKMIEVIDLNSSVEAFFQNYITPYLSQNERPIQMSIQKYNVEIIPQTTTTIRYSIYLSLQDEEQNDPPFIKSLFSNREWEILEYVFKGYTNEQISKALWISINTVKKHLRNMYEKTGVSNRTSLLYKIKERDAVSQN